MNIALLLYHRVNELDMVGPYTTLYTAKHFLKEQHLAKQDLAAGAQTNGEREPGEAFGLYTVAKSRNSVETSGGLIITPHWAFNSAPPPDVLIVPGGAGAVQASRDKAVAGYLKEWAPKLKLLIGVSTGVLILGELGFLRDLRATTLATQRERLLDYEVGEIIDARVVKNGSGLWCSGGGAAGIDAGLELLKEFYGADLAEEVARYLNYPLWSPGPLEQGSLF